MNKRFTLKDDCKMEDFQMLSPKVLVLFSTLLRFADNRNLPVVVTSMISDRENVKKSTKTHEEGRAIDVSTKGWREKDIEDIQKIMLLEHHRIAAISYSDLKPKPCVYHNYENQGDHLHLQVRR